MTRVIKLPLTCREVKIIACIIPPLLMLIGYQQGIILLMGLGFMATLIEGVFLLIFILVWFMENDSPLSFSCRCDNDS